MVVRIFKALLILVLFAFGANATKMGTIRSGGDSAHVAKVEADSALSVSLDSADTINVLVVDSLVVKQALNDTLNVNGMNTPLRLAQGLVSGHSFVHKFGNAPDFDAADGTVTVWDGADDAHVDAMAYVYSTTADINRVSSSAADSFSLEIQGLGADTLALVDTVTVAGQAKVTISPAFFRVFRMRNINSVDNVGHVYAYADCAISSGVPAQTDSVRAVVQPGNNQTLMSIYTVPVNKTAYMPSWYAATAGANRSSNYVIELRARQRQGVFQLKHVTALGDAGTSSYQHKYEVPEMFNSGVDIEMRANMQTGGGVAASVSTGFDLILIDN